MVNDLSVTAARWILQNQMIEAARSNDPQKFNYITDAQRILNDDDRRQVFCLLRTLSRLIALL